MCFMPKKSITFSTQLYVRMVSYTTNSEFMEILAQITMLKYTVWNNTRMNGSDSIPLIVQEESETDARSLTTKMQNPNEEYYQKTLQDTDKKYQHITYWKWGKFETVDALKLIPIDLQKALNEAEKLLWEHEESIGFTNGKNKDAIHITRKEENLWHAHVPIFTKDEWDGYYWSAFSDTKTMFDVIRLFFEEVEWFGMLDFKMRRKH